MKSIQTGDVVPDFSLPDQNDNIFDIKTFLGKKNWSYSSILRMEAMDVQRKPAISGTYLSFSMKRMQ